MVSKDVWGPSTWTLFHTLAEKVKEEHFAALLPEMLVMVKRICMNLPCPDCSAHAIQIMAKVTPAQFPNKDSFKLFLLRFHNSVNARTNKRAFTLEEGVRMITMTPAMTWGFTGRGLVREGYIADLNIFNPDTIAPGMPEVVSDLPTGAQRLKQKSVGILATVIGGTKTFVNGEHTGALAGRMLRSGSGGIQ
jgi:N-acyl-D-aspartate/D-glutamate deacylase